MKSDWKMELDEAKGFARTVINSHAKGKFDNTFKFNLLTLAIEKYLVSYLNFIKYPPVTHGINTLMSDVSRKRDVAPEMKDAVNKIGLFQNICSGGELKIPNNDELSSMIETLESVKTFIEGNIEAESQAL